jgi:hypothetical protein
MRNSHVRRLSLGLCAAFALSAQDVPNAGTVDLYRQQLNRLGGNLTTGQHDADLNDAAARGRLALRAPLLADPNLSLAELQTAQTALIRLNDRLNADAERAAQERRDSFWVQQFPSFPVRPYRVSPDPNLAALRAEAQRLGRQRAAPVVLPPAGSPNLALGKPTRQSSFRFLASRGGVDGVRSGTYGFYTESQPNPWWDVDLQQARKITEIRVYNSKINPERARTLQVLLSGDGINWHRAYAHNGSVFGADGQPLLIPLNGERARWVRLQLGGTNYLHLEEIEVYAAPEK